MFYVTILLFENILELDDLMYCVSPGQPFITIRKPSIHFSQIDVE